MTQIDERPQQLNGHDPTIREVLDFVGSDRARAREVIDRELARGPRARKTLITKLQPIAIDREEAIGPTEQPRPFDPRLPLPFATPTAAQPSRRGWWSLWRIAALAGAVLLLLTNGFLLANDLGAHRQLSSTRSTLLSTTRRLAAIRSQLQVSQAQLSSSQAEVSSLQDQVSKLQSSLSDAQSAIGVAANVIAELKTCLNGVSSTLTDDLNGDYLSGTVALESVTGTCQEANAAVNALNAA